MSTPAADQIPILVVGDWVVDEHWVVGTHRAEASSRTGKDHARALHKASSSVRSLCGAGQVASILHQARLGEPSSGSQDPSQSRIFRVLGLGIWARGDTDILASMVEPEFNAGQTPHQLSIKPRSNSSPSAPRLFNLAESCGEGSSGTTRVIRIYQNTSTRLELKQRLDWALPQTEDDFTKLRDSRNLDLTLAELAQQKDLKHILIKDLRKGAVDTSVITWLSKRFPEASWYVSTKEWMPKWLSAVPQARLRLLTIPQLAAQKAIEAGDISASSWITVGNVPAQGALQKLDQLAQQYCPNGRIVVFPDSMTVLARDHTLQGFVGRALAELKDEVAFTPMASVFFASTVARLAAEKEGRIGDKGSASEAFKRILHLVGAFTLAWEREEAKRFTTFDWKPGALHGPGQGEVQVLHLRQAVEAERSAVKWTSFEWKDTLEDWSNAFTEYGIVRNRDTKKDEFHVWRAMTELDGYITCNPYRRNVLLSLIREGQSFLRASPGERRHKSFLISDVPGSGKSYLVNCLANALGLKAVAFNIAQLLDRNHLIECFKEISSEQSRRKLNEPLLVFFDEINDKNAGVIYDLFLDPLENGTYIDRGRTHRLEPCFWIFAGTGEPPSEQKSTKAPDFLSRMTAKFTLSAKDQNDSTAQIEQVYIGVAAIREAFPEVSHVSPKVLHAFHIFPGTSGPRGLKRFVRSFEYVQYGRVMAANVPKNWLPEFKDTDVDRVFKTLLKKWEIESEQESDLIEIKSRPER